MFTKGLAGGELFDPPRLEKDFGDGAEVLAVDFFRREIFALLLRRADGGEAREVHKMPLSKSALPEPSSTFLGSPPPLAVDMAVDWLAEEIAFVVKDEEGAFELRKCDLSE